jgi:hypothetical protein
MMGVGPAQGRPLAIFQTLEFSLASPAPRELAFHLSNDPLRLGITESCEMLWDRWRNDHLPRGCACGASGQKQTRMNAPSI